MRIYTKVVIDIKTGNVIRADTFEYAGPIARCGGSGGGGSDAVDKSYNRGMLALSQEQQSWAREMFNMFKYGVNYDPYSTDAATGKTLGELQGYDASKVSEMDLMNQYFKTQSEVMPKEAATITSQLGLEKAQAEAQQGLIPSQVSTEQAKLATERAGYGLTSAQIAEQYKLLGPSTATELAKMTSAQAGYGLSTAQAESEQRLLPQREELAGLGMTQAKQILTERSPVISQLYRDALSGVDINRRVSEARAGVQQAFAGAETGMTRNLARYGLSPTESDFRGIEIAKATSMAGQEGMVRREAEDENFKRRVTALGLQF